MNPLGTIPSLGSAPVLAAQRDGFAGPELSVVVPVYNEEESLDALYTSLHALLGGLGIAFEVVMVNDGSHDRSREMLADIAQRDERFRAIHFSRNFGHQAAVTAGLRYARGRAIVVMDADLQDPPELLGQMLARWREGYHVVYAQRVKRHQETWFKRAMAFAYYRLLQRLTDVEIPSDTGDFCLMDRKVVDLLNSMPERNRYIRGLRAWIGFRQIAIPFERPPRFAGEVKYTFWKSLGLAVNGIVSFSKVPLRLATYLGLFVSAASFLLAIYFIIEKLRGELPVRGWASTVVIILFLGGIQLLTIGVVGEYLSRIYDEVKKRPMYVVSDVNERQE
jgi:polyisoprenyl-phosphate glycosyltransferase